MPENATNRDRISGDGLELALAWAVMSAIESDWNLSNVKARGSEALGEVGNVYKILDADINPYHDVTFGIYVKDSDVGGEENPHVHLKRKDFPPGFAVTAILHFRVNTLSFSRLQANPIFGYSFYSFSYSLYFVVKRYHWCQWKPARMVNRGTRPVKCRGRTSLGSSYASIERERGEMNASLHLNWVVSPVLPRVLEAPEEKAVELK